MEEEDGDASTPFWLQSRRSNNTYFSRTSSLGGRAATVATQVFIAGVAAILIVFFIIPPFVSSVSQIFRPHLVRKSWDYLNFVLVLFAVLCGFLSRNSGNEEIKEDTNKSNNNGFVYNKFTSSPRGDQTVYKRYSRLKSSSSYPDLSLREFESDERWRFYDDTRVSQCRYESCSYPIYQTQEIKPEEEETAGEEIHKETKVEAVATETEVVREVITPSPPPSKQAKRKTKRVYQDVTPMEEKKEIVYEKSSKQEKKKGGATKEFLIALRRKKKKKQRQQSIDGLDLLFGSSSDPPFTYSIPPPPPPPPPPPFFQGLFTSSNKKGKSKRTNSNNPPPPPPPPPLKSRASKAPVESRTSKPNPPPAKVTQYVGIGNESPLMPIPPPPPPPPPFKMPAWKFVKRGDYVRMASNISISSDEPDDETPFCPSPDVDTKADNFIARFRAGLKLEKMNSVKRSNLGPEPGPAQSAS